MQAQVQGLPRTVAVPFWLKKRDLPHFRVRLRCCIDRQGRALASLLESCGQRDMDYFLIEQVQSLPWKPATRGGQACESSLEVTIQGDFSQTQQEFTLRRES